jgi:hypothetical protein
MDIEDRYRLKYEKAVNELNRGDGSPESQKHYRARVEQLRRKHVREREREIEKIIYEATGETQSGG